MSALTRLNRSGGTLPLTILVLSLMGVGVAISYTRVSSERRITGDSRAQLGAFAVAQSGLNRFLSNINGKPAGTPPDQNVTYNDLPGGSATVNLRMLRESTITLLPAVYIITSRGTYTGAKRYDGLTPAAERTVATYALWTTAPFDLNAGFTSISGITKNGGSGALSGIDRCAAQSAIPGVAVPNGGYTGDVTIINGNPEDAAVGMGTGGLGGTAKDEVDIDWAGIVAGTYLPAGFLYPSWPTAAQMLNWPVSRVNGDLTLPGTGKGILIVTGNLTISGGDQWEGLVLVGGTITSNGNNTVYGATVSGLNIKLGIAVPASTIANGNKTYQYDSCSLARALGKVGSIQRVRNDWTDTWSSY